MAMGLRRYERVQYIDKAKDGSETTLTGVVTSLFEPAFQPSREAYVKWDAPLANGEAGRLILERQLNRVFG